MPFLGRNRSIMQGENCLALFNISHGPSLIGFELLLLKKVLHVDFCLARFFNFFEENLLLRGRFALHQLFNFIIGGHLLNVSYFVHPICGSWHHSSSCIVSRFDFVAKNVYCFSFHFLFHGLDRRISPRYSNVDSVFSVPSEQTYNND